METLDILASKDVSFVSNVDDIAHSTAFDALFDKVVNQSLSHRPPASFKRCLPGDVRSVDCEFQSRCGNITRSDFDSYIHNLTLDGAFTTPSFLNASILSHFTTRPSAARDAASIHHKIQMLKFERQNRHDSTLNSTFMNSKSDKNADFGVGLTNKKLMTHQNGLLKDFTRTLTSEEDQLSEEAEQVVSHIPDGTENEPVIIDSDSNGNTPSPSLGPDTAASRRKRSVRQTPKMAQLMQETSKLPRLEKAFKVTVELSDWIIKPLPDCRGVCVEGKREGMLDFWHSTAITSVKSPRHVMTASGSEYQLKGSINELCTVDSGFTVNIAKAFKNGFPKKWKQLIEQFYATLEDSIPVEEEISFVKNLGIKKFPAKRGRGRPKKRNPKQTSKIASKEGNRKKVSTSNVTPKLKSFSSEEDLDSVLTPVGLIKKSLATASLKVTRSGRLSLPPLARWSGQRYVLRDSEMMVDFRTNDARRAVMAETKAVYKLSKPHQKMLGCQKSAGLSPTVNGKPASDGFKKSKQRSPTGKKLTDKKAIISDKNFEKAHALQSNASDEARIRSRNIKRRKSPPKKDILPPKNNSRQQASRRRQSSDGTASANGKQKKRRSSGRLKLKKCSIVLEKKNFTPRTVSRLCQETKVPFSRKENLMTEMTNTKRANRKSSVASKGLESKKKAACKENSQKKQEAKRQRKTVKNTSKDNTSLDNKCEKSVVKKGKRRASSSPPFICNLELESKGGKIEESTPKSSNRNYNALKKRRITPEETVEDSWSDHEKDCLQRAVRNVNNSSSDFWNEVALAVETKTSEECQAFYTNYLEDKTGQKLNKSKGKSLQISGRQKGDPVQSRKGTMKRKKEIRAFLDEQNEGYEDNPFDGTPFARRKPVSSLVNKISFDKGDDEIFGANCNFFTPISGRDKVLSPQSCLRVPFASTKKTPILMSNFVNSPLSAQRHCADKYIHTFMDKKKKSIIGAGTSATNKDADLESSLLPKKSLFSPTGKASIFLEDDKELDDDELHDDDEQDNRYMYYWNDLDTSQ